LSFAEFSKVRNLHSGLSAEPITDAQLVFFMRGEKVMFDADLAMLYGVEVRSLNQAVARNRKRFPADFAFQLTDDELAALRSQLVISKSPSGARSRRRDQVTKPRRQTQC
jgi:reverse gyrase